MIKQKYPDWIHRGLIGLLLLSIGSGYFLQNCAASRNNTIRKGEIANFRKIGIISVYTARGEKTGLVSRVTGSPQIEEAQRRLSAASPSQLIMNGFITGSKRFTTADFIIIRENETVVSNVKEEDMMSIIPYYYYAFENLDHAFLTERFDIDSLITIETSDDTISDRYGAYMRLITSAQLTDIQTNEIVWEKTVKTKRENIGFYSKELIERFMNIHATIIVNDLLKDWAH
jgi:hypothetical protein